MPVFRPPRSEEELLTRARELGGRTLAELAARCHQVVPPDQRRAKGWVGQLIEICLGATASSRPAPDFERIGVELKTIPIGARGIPVESTYVCTAKLTDLSEQSWDGCWVRKKLARVLWLPVQAAADLPLGSRRVGAPLLWSPDADEEATLRADWEELSDLIRMGKVDEISARRGEWLQLRPKAADASARCWGIDENGHRYRTLPRGYYLRARFTTHLLQKHFVMPAAR